jgi:transcriptional regulator with XRE-family HTH domain
VRPSYITIVERDSSDPDTLRARARLYMEVSGTTQRELAGRTGVPQATLSRFLGGASISAAHAARLQRGIDVGAHAPTAGDAVGGDEVLWAMRHVAFMRDTDVFPRPPEFELLATTPVPVLSALGAVDLATHTPRTARTALAPKATTGFRLVSQLDPLDTLLYAGAVHAVAPQIEAVRAPETEVFSYRAEPDENGALWKNDVRWSGFVARGKELAAQDGCRTVLVADIADCYGQVAIPTVMEALEDAGVGAVRTATIGRLLDRFAGRRGRGLPVGPHPSALLAELVLNRVDDQLRRAGRPFVRYVDDIRIFCRDERDARAAWHDLAAFLPDRLGLSLNDAKSRIVTSDTFVEQEDQALYDDPEEGEPDEDEGLEDMPRSGSWGDIRRVLDDQQVRQALADGSVRRLRRAVRGAIATSLDDLLLNREHLVRMVPIFRDLCLHLLQQRPKGSGAEVAQNLLWLATESTWADVGFVRLWVAEVLCTRFFRVLGPELDAFLVRSRTYGIGLAAAATLAVNREDREWVRSCEREWDHLDPWDRRAVLSATRILSDRERDRWASRAEETRDPLLVALAHQVRTVPPAKQPEGCDGEVP